MNAFRIGERVELISCPNFPGTVTGLRKGSAAQDAGSQRSVALP